jgi:putative hydrolase of the HAD superfamily
MYPNLSNVSAVSFDLWQTLVHGHPDYKPERVAIIRERLGLDESFQARVMAVALDTDVEINKHSDRTGFQYGPVERLQEIANALGASVSAEWLEETARLLQVPVAKFPPLLMEEDLLGSLALIQSTGRKIVLASNTGFINGEAMRIGLTANGIWPFVDGAVFSNEVGVAKPHRRIFEEVSRVSGQPFATILHVGDNRAADYEGALAAGVNGCLLSSEAPYDVAAVASIAELAALMTK